MSDSMIERVADAIRRVEGCTDSSLADCEMCDADRPDSCMNLARAAIEAMREPTAAMSEAGYKTGMFSSDEHSGDAEDASWVWQAMIDAALADAPPEAAE